MIWVILVVLVCEVVIFTQLMLNFQMRGDRLKIARAPIFKRIEQHRQALVELSEKVQTKTAESLEKIDEKIADATHSAMSNPSTPSPLLLGSGYVFFR